MVKFFYFDEKERFMKIAVDFDGTCVDHCFPAVGSDVPGAVDYMKRLAADGHQLFLFTMRSGEFLENAVQWFVNRHIPLSGINSDPGQTSWTDSPKCYAEVYIDDAALGAPLVQLDGFQRECLNWTAVETWFIKNKKTNASVISNSPGVIPVTFGA